MKKITAVAALLCAAGMTGCSLGGSDGDKAQTSADAGGEAVSQETRTDHNVSSEEEPADPLAEAEEVAAMYLKAANAEFDQSMVKLMTDDYAAEYEYMKQNIGHDDEYGDEEEQLSGVKYNFDKEKSGFIDKVNIEEEYSKAAELYVTVSYDSSEGDVTSSQYILTVLDKDNDWKVCFAGTKAQAYTDGIITDENSEAAFANAQIVFESAQKAYDELSKDKDYKFDYLNYISTEKDKFIEKIKSELPDELKESYFTVFLDNGKLDYVVWSEQMGAEISVTYPEKK